MNEVAVKEKNELVTKDDIEFLIWFDEQKKRAAVIEKRIKESGHNFLEKNDLLETGYKAEADGATLHIYETKPYKKKQVDIKALKEQGLYDQFVEEVWVKGSVRIQVNYDD